MQQRDFQIFPLYGQFKFSGSISGPAFPTNAVPLLAGAYGKDGGQGGQLLGFGVTANPYPGSGGTTLSTAITSGQVAHGDGPQISYDATHLTDPNATFQPGIVGSEIETFSGKKATVTGQTGTQLTVASWTGGTPTAGESYNVGPKALTLAAAGGFAANDVIQVDVNSGGATTSEIRQIASGAGTTSITLDHGLWYAHAAGVNVRKVGNAGAPIANTLFQHFFVPGNLLDSFTLEKNLGGFQSELYTGVRVVKHSFKAQATNTPVEYTADLLAAAAPTPLTTPTALTVVNEAPMVFAEGTITLFGQVTQEITSIQIDLQNGVKDTYTFNQSHNPAYVTPVSRKASGQLSLVFTSLNDATKGYFVGSGVTGATPFAGAIDVTFAHPSSGGVYQIHLNKCRISKYGDDLKINDVIMVNLSFEAEYDLSATPALLGYGSVQNNSKYLPY